MKKTRLFKHFITLIHCCALAIPLFTLIGTFIFNYLAPTAYFASHKSVNQSTYDVQYKYQSNEVNNVNDLVEGNLYLYTINATSDQFTIEYETILIFEHNNYNNLILISNNSYIDQYNEQIEISYYDINDDEQFISNNEINNFSILFTYETIDIVNTDLGIQYFIHYTDYNEIESVEIDNHNDFEDMKNYQPKTFDDACFYTMQSMGVAYHGDDVIDVLYNSTGETLSSVYYMYSMGYSCSDFYAFNGVVNYDWLEMFNVNLNFEENTTNGSWYFFVNFYINYFINMSLILFMPIVIMGFLKFCTNLILKFIEKGEDY